MSISIDVTPFSRHPTDNGVPNGELQPPGPPIKLSIELKLQDFVVGTCNLSLENLYKKIEMTDAFGSVFSFTPNEKVHGRIFNSSDDNVCGDPFSNSKIHGQAFHSIDNKQEKRIPNDLMKYSSPPQRYSNGGALPNEKAHGRIFLSDDENVCGDPFSHGKIHGQTNNSLSSNKRPIRDTNHQPKGLSHKKFNIEKIADTLSHSKINSKNSFTNHTVIKKEEPDYDSKEGLILDRNHFESPSNESYITVVPVENPIQINNFSIRFPPNTSHNAGSSSQDETNDMMPSVTYHSLDSSQKKAILRGALESLPLTCHVCGEGFERTCHFETHMKTMHSNIKAFNCKDCEVGFARKGDFQKHIVSVHKTEDKKIYECQVCGKKFWKRCYRDKHKHSMHPMSQYL